MELLGYNWCHINLQLVLLHSLPTQSSYSCKSCLALPSLFPPPHGRWPISNQEGNKSGGAESGLFLSSSEQHLQGTELVFLLSTLILFWFNVRGFLFKFGLKITVSAILSLFSLIRFRLFSSVRGKRRVRWPTVWLALCLSHLLLLLAGVPISFCFIDLSYRFSCLIF